MRTLRTLAPFGAAALLLGAVSCATGGTTSSPAALPMQQHWEAGNALQHAMVRGDLTAARRAAGRIAEVEEIPGLTWDAGMYLARMRAEAILVQSARTFDAAAVSTGRMGAACGACHARGGVGPRFPGTAPEPTVEEDDPDFHMIRHGWAVDRMWEGLVVPSGERWQAGAHLLGDHPLSVAGVSPEIALMAARVHEMAKQAEGDETQDERAERFGRIISDCAGCHAELGIQ